jgi:transcriptional regulator
MAGKQRTFDKETRIKIEGVLDNLPEKPKAERALTTKELVSELKAKIKVAQAKGYTLEEIVELFKQNGAQISLSTVKASLKGTTKKPTVKATDKAEQV